MFSFQTLSLQEGALQTNAIPFPINKNTLKVPHTAQCSPERTPTCYFLPQNHSFFFLTIVQLANCRHLSNLKLLKDLFQPYFVRKESSLYQCSIVHNIKETISQSDILYSFYVLLNAQKFMDSEGIGEMQ